VAARSGRKQASPKKRSTHRKRRKRRAEVRKIPPECCVVGAKKKKRKGLYLLAAGHTGHHCHRPHPHSHGCGMQALQHIRHVLMLGRENKRKCRRFKT